MEHRTFTISEEELRTMLWGVISGYSLRMIDRPDSIACAQKAIDEQMRILQISRDRLAGSGKAGG